MSDRTVKLNEDELYQAWRAYMLENSIARYFGAFNDGTVGKMPYATLTIVGMPTNATDLENYEYTVNLTIQTDCYIDSMKITDLFDMDAACWDFFNMLGFRRTGDSAPSKIQNSSIKRITSRFTMNNFCGKFLIDITPPTPPNTGTGGDNNTTEQVTEPDTT